MTEMIEIILIAVGLAMDAFAVSISCGAGFKCFDLKYALKIAFLFGLFQAVMPLAGWLLGSTFIGWFIGYTHWVAFGLLFLIGMKMLIDAVKEIRSKEEKPEFCYPKKLSVLLGLALATSIDAFAVGLSFSMLKMTIMSAVIIIGVITFILSFAGKYIGYKIGHIFEDKVEIVGALILIGISLKIIIMR